MDGRVEAPVLHLVSDMHSVEFGFLKWLVGHCDVRATLNFDRFHGVTNALEESVKKSGMMLHAMQWRVFLDCRRKPFNEEANHSILHECAQEMRSTSNHENVLFRHLAEQIAQDMDYVGDSPCSEPWYEDLWKEAFERFLKRGIGEEAKPCRWFACERRTRQAEEERTMVLMLICWHGFKRKWWRTMDECPLCTTDLILLGDGGHGDVLAVPAADADRRL